ncbi:hypothetical protein B5C02_12135 [Staphylococcus pseudintermedius]|nr:hypothetical protein B5C02_12135 [Staphylococcus pseudintermedius]
MRHSYKIKDVTFTLILFCMIRSYSILILLVSACVILPYVLTLEKEILFLAIEAETTFLFGIIFSFALHEFFHIFFLKKRHGDSNVDIIFGWNKITVVPFIPAIDGYTIIKVAVYPLLILFSFGIILFLIALVADIFLFKILSLVYILHIINIIPPLGDGMMLIKGIFKLIERR